MLEKQPNFKEFRSFGTRLKSNNLGITKNGTLSFYSGFYQRNELNKFSRCLILFDESQHLLGIQFGGEELGKGSYVINHSSTGRNASISAGNFFVLKKLDLSKISGKYYPEKYEDETRKNVFVVDLTKKVQKEQENNK